MKTPKQVVKEWIRCWDTRNADEAIELYHEEAVNLQLAVGHPLVGKKAIHKEMVDFFHAIPDSFTHEENFLEDGEWVAVEWSGGGTYQPSGKPFKLSGSGFFHVIDGKIKLQRGYWDKATLFGQMGFPIE